MATPTPAAPWPAGWDGAFCTAFAEIVVAQELAVDIGRAFDEGDRDDAAALAHELGTTIEEARRLLDAMPEWTPAAGFHEQAAVMLELDELLVRYWLRHIEEGRRPALGRARGYEDDLREEGVPAVQAELDLLAGMGVDCPGQELQLESP